MGGGDFANQSVTGGFGATQGGPGGLYDHFNFDM